MVSVLLLSLTLSLHFWKKREEEKKEKMISEGGVGGGGVTNIPDRPERRHIPVEWSGGSQSHRLVVMQQESEGTITVNLHYCFNLLNYTLQDLQD